MSRSSEAPPEEGSDSVYDFLYQDAARIGSLLSQLGDGPLQSFKRVIATGSNDKQEASYGGKIGVSGTGAHRTETEGTASENRESLERGYDPLWGNALLLLDILHGRGVIRRKLDGATIGQFVIASGALVIMDLAMLRDLWRRPSFQQLIKAEANNQDPAISLPQGLAAGNRAERRRQGKSQERSAIAQPSVTEIGLDLVDLLPHTIQGWILEPDCEAFFTLQAGGLTIPSGDLMLKHGAHVGRGWNVLGIVDAVPGGMSEEDINDLVRVTMGSAMGQLVTGLAQPVRELMGRPDTAYSVTPLLIFRPVAQEDDWEIVE